jgi:glycosyltransferase involved in cell wall biosynthesis
MSMSVIEAMQAGLVPIVTPVGEIARYCVDNFNAVLVQEDVRTCETIIELLNNPSRYAELSAQASLTWASKPIYRDDVLTACNEILR